MENIGHAAHEVLLVVTIVIIVLVVMFDMVHKI